MRHASLCVLHTDAEGYLVHLNEGCMTFWDGYLTTWDESMLVRTWWLLGKLNLLMTPAVDDHGNLNEQKMHGESQSNVFKWIFTGCN